MFHVSIYTQTFVFVCTVLFHWFYLFIGGLGSGKTKPKCTTFLFRLYINGVDFLPSSKTRLTLIEKIDFNRSSIPSPHWLTIQGRYSTLAYIYSILCIYSWYLYQHYFNLLWQSKPQETNGVFPTCDDWMELIFSIQYVLFLSLSQVIIHVGGKWPCSHFRGYTWSLFQHLILASLMLRQVVTGNKKYCIFLNGLFQRLVPQTWNFTIGPKQPLGGGRSTTCEEWLKPSWFAVHRGLYYYGDYNKPLSGYLWANQYNGMSQ